MLRRDREATSQVEKGPLANTLGNTKGVDQAVAVVLLTTAGCARLGTADKHADILAGETATVNASKPFYGITFRISEAVSSYLSDYASIFIG